MTRNAPPFPNLPSTKAALIRDLLRQKKTRDTERAFVLEGAKPILELLRANFPSLLAVVATPTYLEKSDPASQRALEQGSTPVYTCREMVFEKLSDVSTSPGILAVLKQPEWDQETIFKRPRLFGIYGEGLQDPANVGAIIRTAVAFGLDALWLSSDSVDVFSPKVVRTTTGALLKLPVFSIKDAGVFARHRCALLAAEPPGAHSRAIRDITSISSRTILAFGNESRGLSEATLKQATLRFHIPVSRAIDSLNVAASAAIAVFHFSGLPREGK